MSETENENTTTEPGETVETDVETAEQPEGSQPTEAPAAEPETAEEPGAEETSPEAPVGEPTAAAPEAPAGEPAPAQPVGEPRKRSRRHVPRSLRRQRSKPKTEKPKERKPIVRLEKPEHERGRRQERRGVVVSDAMDKTIVVKV